MTPSCLTHDYSFLPLSQTLQRVQSIARHTNMYPSTISLFLFYALLVTDVCIILYVILDYRTLRCLTNGILPMSSDKIDFLCCMTHARYMTGISVATWRLILLPHTAVLAPPALNMAKLHCSMHNDISLFHLGHGQVLLRWCKTIFSTLLDIQQYFSLSRNIWLSIHCSWGSYYALHNARRLFWYDVKY